MPSFLAALLVLVQAFILGGQPIDIPPYLNEELTSRGIQISDIAKEFHTLAPTSTPQAPIIEDESENSLGDQEENSQEPDKIPAYNNESENGMPTTLPTNAVENSPSLDEASEVSTPPPTVTPTPPEEDESDTPDFIGPPITPEPCNPFPPKPGLERTDICTDAL